MLSRFLYPNPVVLLTVSKPNTTIQESGCSSDVLSTSTSHSVETGAATVMSDSKELADKDDIITNIMTLSWLTAIDNHGHFIFSMNANRHTASLLFSVPIQQTTTMASESESESDQRIHLSTNQLANANEDGSYFVLSVPVDGMQDLVLKVGGISGRDCLPHGKIHHLGIKTCKPGLDPSKELSSTSTAIDTPSLISKPKVHPLKNSLQTSSIPTSLIAVQGTAAHLICQVLDTRIDFGHVIATAVIVDAYADPNYWDGKNFAPKSTASSTPPPPHILKFLGSKRFATVIPCDDS
jgi:flavin reductase (DIM6/NTAB) family NADH-FMN oxidoreductase RutF